MNKMIQSISDEYMHYSIGHLISNDTGSDLVDYM